MREDQELTTMQGGWSHDLSDKGTVPQYPSKTKTTGLVTVTGPANSPVISNMQRDILYLRFNPGSPSASQDEQGAELDGHRLTYHVALARTRAWAWDLGPEVEDVLVEVPGVLRAVNALKACSLYAVFPSPITRDLKHRYCYFYWADIVIKCTDNFVLTTCQELP